MRCVHLACGFRHRVRIACLRCLWLPKLAARVRGLLFSLSSAICFPSGRANKPAVTGINGVRRNKRQRPGNHHVSIAVPLANKTKYAAFAVHFEALILTGALQTLRLSVHTPNKALQPINLNALSWVGYENAKCSTI